MAYDPYRPTWDAIVGGLMFRYGTADCRCPCYRHVQQRGPEHDPILATMHTPGVCLAGLSYVCVDTRMALALQGLAVPTAAIAVAVPRLVFAATLRGRPGSDAVWMLVAIDDEQRGLAAVGVVA